MGASAPVNPEQFQGMGSLQNYMNPYTSSVVDTTQAEMNNQNQQQAQFLNSANISSGAFGGDRAGIGQSILANQQQLAEAPTIAGLNQANYTQAMSNWQNQQGVNLAAQQANAARQMTGAAQLGEIGQSTQQAGLQGSQAQIQAGMIPQQEQQAIDTAAQNMYQTGQAYPFTTTGWLGNIIEGTGGLSGGQSQTTSPGPNSITQGLGAATQGIGLLGSLMSLSDERSKENVEEIGKTYDNQPIYRYNFKGDPRTQIGLIAQEEAYHDPGSVKRIGMGDLLGVDYHRATDDAAERGHFADGGEAEMPPGGVTQGVTQGAGTPYQKPQAMSPDQALMFMGDPSARSGMGSFGLMGGTNMHPQPEMPIAGRWGGGRISRATGGLTALGNNGSIGMYTPGFQPGVRSARPPRRRQRGAVRRGIGRLEEPVHRHRFRPSHGDRRRAMDAAANRRERAGLWEPPELAAVRRGRVFARGSVRQRLHAGVDHAHRVRRGRTDGSCRQCSGRRGDGRHGRDCRRRADAWTCGRSGRDGGRPVSRPAFQCFR